MGKGSNADDQNFHISGPKHLSPVDWGNDKHRMAVVACLVQGVYVKRKDTKKSRAEAEALGPPWWLSFHFKHFNDLTDISPAYGAIFKFDHSVAEAHGDKSVDKAPEFVVTFRGTQSLLDVGYDVLLSSDRLQHSDRVIQAFKAVDKFITGNSANGRCNVWLAGHSLGASVATYIGMDFAEKSGILLETFLFNPPYLRLDPETLKHKVTKWVVEKLQKLIKNLPIRKFVKETASNVSGNNYKHLHRWIPNLFVNPNDYICKGFIEYFKHQDSLEGMRPGHLIRERNGNHSYDLYRVRWRIDDYSVYLLPSGRVISNVSAMVEHTGLRRILKFKDKRLEAHGINQWWKEGLELEVNDYVPEA